MFSTRSIKSEMAAGLACSRRNMVRAAASSSASRKKICANPGSSDCRNSTQDVRRDYSGRFELAARRAPLSYDWTGFYLGLNAGGAFGTTTAAASGGGGSASVKEPGFIGGAQVGANYQTGPLVWGFEADYDASTQNQSLPSGVSS